MPQNLPDLPENPISPLSSELEDEHRGAVTLLSSELQDDDRGEGDIHVINFVKGF